MKRITCFLLLVAFVGLLFFNLACGGSGYESGDPKNEPAKEAAGVDAPDEPVAEPVPEGSNLTEPPPQDLGD